ncbi:MAG: hypothetical protein QXM77_05205, partial [Candidatus Nitrosocaldus sp.]
YKVFTIASGIFRLSLKGFIIASIIGRGARFYAEAVLIMLWGEQMLAFIDENLEIVSLAVAVAIIAYIVLRRRLTKARRV